MSKPSKKTVLAVLTGLAIIAVLGYAALSPSTEVSTTPVEGTPPATAEQQPAPDAAQTEENVIPEYDEAAAPQWVKDALVDRVLGDPKAPVTIEDFSSLTCPHCADFHTQVLPKLKEEYIDTGKAKLVFADFPLNMAALQATSLSRCVKDNDAYFAYIDQLFTTQKNWGMVENARGNLLNTIKFTGLSRQEAEACLDDKMLTAGIVKKMEAAQSKHSVQSTPTFVINGKTVIRGAQPYEAFKTAIDAELAK